MSLTNPGVYPLDPTSAVGQLRVLIGDIEFTPIDGVTGDYTNFSDDQLSSYLAMGSNSQAYAAGYAFMALAAVAAAQAINVKTADEQVDLTKRADALRAIAAEWFSRGDSILSQAAAAYHQIIQPDYETDDDWPPELASPILDITWWR